MSIRITFDFYEGAGDTWETEFNEKMRVIFEVGEFPIENYNLQSVPKVKAVIENGGMIFESKGVKECGVVSTPPLSYLITNMDHLLNVGWHKQDILGEVFNYAVHHCV